MAARQSNPSARGSKTGRNKKYHERRVLLGLEKKNQIRRIKRHIRKSPNDHAAEVHLTRIKTSA
jgi:hypothetical protein